MTNSDSNAGDALRQWSLVQQQLTEFEDRLEQVLASYAFHQRALRAIIQEARWETDPSHWQLGLLLSQQWLGEQGELLIHELRLIRQK